MSNYVTLYGTKLMFAVTSSYFIEIKVSGLLSDIFRLLYLKCLIYCTEVPDGQKALLVAKVQ